MTVVRPEKMNRYAVVSEAVMTKHERQSELYHELLVLMTARYLHVYTCSSVPSLTDYNDSIL
jgi:hypothetical protein